MLEGFAETFETADIHVDLLFADDFVSATQKVLDVAPWDGAPTVFDTERLGGETVAKNIDLSSDSSHVAVLMNRQILAPDGRGGAHTIFLLAHELTHPILNRLRHQSGILENVMFPSVTPIEFARSVARIAADEYRADRAASAVLGHFATRSTTAGEPEAMTVWDLMGSGYTDQLSDVLSATIWPGWPDLITSYRHHHVSLERLWSGIVSSTDQTLTLLAHAQAVADIGDQPGPVEVTRSHPGTERYIGPVWSSLMDVLDQHNAIGTADVLGVADDQIADIAEHVVLEMWRKLGLTFTLGDEREDYFIHVSDSQQ
ncbi:MAG: hypothetical protein JWP74_2070 [Marmoricola sp.]|nr:hypothetical protein [Marmoricola sp.]